MLFHGDWHDCQTKCLHVLSVHCIKSHSGNLLLQVSCFICAYNIHTQKHKHTLQNTQPKILTTAYYRMRICIAPVQSNYMSCLYRHHFEQRSLSSRNKHLKICHLRFIFFNMLWRCFPALKIFLPHLSTWYVNCQQAFLLKDGSSKDTENKYTGYFETKLHVKS